MKSLYFSDLHAHNYKEFSELKDGVNSRLLDCLRVLDEIVKCAKENKVEEIRFLGDLFHLKNNLDSAVLRLVIEKLLDLADDFSLVVVPGNHDYISWSSNPALLEMLDGFSGVMDLYLEGGMVEDERPCVEKLWVEPFTRKLKEQQERLEAADPPEGTIFLAHQDIIGVDYHGITVEQGLDPKLLAKKFLCSFVGHYHSSTVVKDSAISVGAPLQHNFNDVGGKRGWWIHDPEQQQLDFFENTFSPKFHNIEVDKDTELLSVGDAEKDFYRVVVKGTEAPDILNSIKWKRVSYEVTSKKKDRGELKFSDTTDSLIEKYVNARGGELEKERLIKLGRQFL